jgi:hypothetical protein
VEQSILALKGLLTVLVTEGIVSVGHQFGRDLSGKAAMLAAAIVGAVLFFLTSILASLTPDQQTQATSLLALLVVILSAFGANDIVKNYLAKPSEVLPVVKPVEVVKVAEVKP